MCKHVEVELLWMVVTSQI